MTRRRARARILALASLMVAGVACADDASPGEEDATARVGLRVGPLGITAVRDVDYAVAIFSDNRPMPSFDANGEVVDATHLVWGLSSIRSSDFGTGDGDVAYVGPCDATVPVSWAALALKTIEVEPGRGSYPVAPGAQDLLDDQSSAFTDDPGSNDGDPDFENPCPYDAPCIAMFACVENQDTRVAFDLFVLRDADAGFFDVAVDFDDLLCSAKADSCSPDATPIELLSGDDSGVVQGGWGDGAGLDMTLVAALSCVDGGAASGPPTLLFSAIAIHCLDAVSTPVTFAIRPIGDDGGEGSSHHVGSTDGRNTLNYGLYFGADQEVGAHYVLAVNLGDLEGQHLTECALSYDATAVTATAPDALAAGLVRPGSGVVYPVIRFDAVPLTDAAGQAICDANPLDGTTLSPDVPSRVTSTYLGTAAADATNGPLCLAWDGGGSMSPIEGAPVECAAGGASTD